MSGVTNEGFDAPTLGDLLTQLNGVWRSVFGAAVNVAARSRHGQLIAGFAGPLSEAWKIGQDLATVFSNPAGVMLDSMAKLTNTFRRSATKSAAVLTLTGTPTTVVGLGKVAGVNGTTAQFATTAAATIASVTAWATGQPITAGARRTANGNVYQAKNAGTTAGAGAGPAGTGNNIADNDIFWLFLGAGTGAVDVNAAATVTGPVQGYSGTITVISTPVSGWAGVNNVLDAAPGDDAEQDPRFRVRRDQEVAGQGKSPLDAIRAQLLRVTGVTSAVVFENTLDVTTDGIAAHGIEAMVEGGLDQDLANTIFASDAGGIETSGTTSMTVVDSAGNSHTVKFSRPAEVDIYIAIALSVDARRYPADGDAQVADALAAAGDALRVGYDVFNGTFVAAAMKIPGVLNFTTCFVGTAPSPVAATVVISPRQRAAFDTSRVAVTTTPGSS